MQKTKSIPQPVLELADELGIGGSLYAILDVTQEMFPGPVIAETGYDPEWPEDRWITFMVEDESDFKESVQREIEWNRRVLEMVPDRARSVGLSVIPR